VKVSAYYEGESFEEAIETIVSGLDYAFRRVIEGAYVVTPYEEAILMFMMCTLRRRNP